MRQLLYIILSISFSAFISCSKTTSSTEHKDFVYPEEFKMFEPGNSVCFIEFTNEVEGMKVKAALKPYMYFSDDSLLIGDAEVRLYENDSTLAYSFQVPRFGMYGISVDTICDGQVLKIPYNMPDYDTTQRIDFYTFHRLPFFFLDVNFDGKKDLVITYFREGQRWTNAYQARSFEPVFKGMYYDYLRDALRRGGPYYNLDDMSSIDYRKQEISTYDKVGYSGDERYIYKPIDGEIRLYAIETYDDLGAILARRIVFNPDTTYHNGYNGQEWWFHKTE